MTDDAPAVRLRKRHVAAVAAGNALEFYDFLTYSFFAVYIGETFFPSTDPTSSLLASLAAFGAGFITRPIGGMVLGSLGDRIGRRPAMFLSFTLMGVAIVGVALTPSYAVLGVAAPVLVIGFRLVQGFALGGEVGPTTAFLIEAAPAARRGFYGSLQAGSQFVSTFSAGIVGTLLATHLDHAALASWGWRAAFLLGALTVPFGLFVRRSLPETMHAQAAEAPEPVLALLVRHARVILAGLTALVGGTVGVYVILYLSTYAMTTLAMPATSTFASAIVVGLCGLTFAPLGGWLSDRFGRRPVMIVTTALTLLVTIPAFAALAHFRTWPVLFAAAAALASCHCMAGAVAIMAIPESLPARIRAGATSTIYAFAIAIFGGTTQIGIAWLTARTGDPLAPAYYMSAALAVGLVGMILMRESAPVKQR